MARNATFARRRPRNGSEANTSQRASSLVVLAAHHTRRNKRTPRSGPRLTSSTTTPCNNPVHAPPWLRASRDADVEPHRCRVVSWSIPLTTWWALLATSLTSGCNRPRPNTSPSRMRSASRSVAAAEVRSVFNDDTRYSSLAIVENTCAAALHRGRNELEREVLLPESVVDASVEMRRVFFHPKRFGANGGEVGRRVIAARREPSNTLRPTDHPLTPQR